MTIRCASAPPEPLRRNTNPAISPTRNSGRVVPVACRANRLVVMPNSLLRRAPRHLLDALGAGVLHREVTCYWLLVTRGRSSFAGFRRKLQWLDKCRDGIARRR